MLLKKLIKICPKNLFNIKVKGLSSDTRSLKRGDLFFALKGSQNNGEKFINQALKKGACAIITSKKIKGSSKIIQINMLGIVLKKLVLNFITKNQKTSLLSLVLMEKVLWRIFFIKY